MDSGGGVALEEWFSDLRRLKAHHHPEGSFTQMTQSKRSAVWPENLISNKFPGEATAAGLGALV